MKYREDADVLTVTLREKRKLSHAIGVGGIIVHFGDDVGLSSWKY
jgi:hypothetical protein